ncbi:hypothetical protein [Microvirga splendida]|uniref:Uncharacterized protein n=1 Tax=Microvirga splendida TaxID=2795727 RepID=A0ABS0Y1P0_9HYPH|nr:hypothetical protein [Microvirga splendida]MBJ6126222.1 hypothetical protein [Microvirga splendida]
MQDVWTRSPGVVIAFPNVTERPARPHLPADEPRGEILLFTGVRYERPASNPGPSRPFASKGPGRRRS